VSNDVVMGITAPEDDGQTPLDPDEARGLLPDWIATRADLNLAEEENIAHGIAWGSRAIRRQPVLTPEFLRRLHKQMFGRVWAWAGKYRDSERNIGVAPHSISSALKNLLDDAVTWDELDSYPIDERAARLHHRLTFIHPFPNGNGRCSRVFADLYLEQRGATQFSWGAGLPRDLQRRAYLDAIRAADARDYGPLLAFVRS
jgi:Fic-DOC domain mobile mystery protein B